MTSKTIKFLAAAAVALAAVGIAPAGYAASCDQQGNWREVSAGGRQAKIVVRAKATSDGWTMTDGAQAVSGPLAVIGPQAVTGKFEELTKVKKVGGSEDVSVTFAKAGAAVDYTISVTRKGKTDTNQTEGRTHYQVRASAINASAGDVTSASYAQAQGYLDTIKCERQYKDGKDTFQYDFVLP